MSPAMLAAASAHLPPSSTALTYATGTEQFPEGTAAHFWMSMGVNAHWDNLSLDWPTLLDRIVNGLGLGLVRSSFRSTPGSIDADPIATHYNQSTPSGAARNNQTFWNRFQQTVDAGLKILVSSGETPIWSCVPWAEGGSQNGGGPTSNDMSTLNQDWFPGWHYWQPLIANKRRVRTSGTDWSSSIVGWEAPNEWAGSIGDNSSIGHKITRRWDDLVARHYRRDPFARLRPIVGPSPGQRGYGGSEGEYGDHSQTVDAGNPHPYTYSSCSHLFLNNPNQPIPVDNQMYQKQSVKIKWPTEVGYQAQDSPPTDNTAFPSADRPPLPRDVQALYLLRTYLTHYWTTTPGNTGLVSAKLYKTFVYETHNTPVDGSFAVHGDFGICRHDFSLTVASTAIKNLVTLLGTKSAPAVVDSLSYSVSGFTNRDFAVSSGRWYPGGGVWGTDADTDHLYHFSVKRADDTYLIFLWRSHNAYVWDFHTENFPYSSVAPLVKDARVQTVTASPTVTVTIPNATAVATANPRLDSTFTTATLNSAGTPSANYQFTYNHPEVVCLRVTM